MSDQTEVKRALCWGCWLGAGVRATVENGKVIKLEGEPDHPLNRGWLCERSKGFIEHLYHEDRLNYPVKRAGERGEGKWQKITWEQGLDEVAEKLKQVKEEYGAEAAATICGTGRGHHRIFGARFMNLFGSPNNTGAGQWCSINSRVVEYATYGASTSFQAVLRQPECIVIWGQNPEESVPCTYRTYLELKDMGTKFIVIDPKYTETVSQLADLWLQIRPGTDAALALGWLNVIIEEELYDREFVKNWCYGFDKLRERVKEYPLNKVAEITGIPEGKIVELGRTYATSKPASIAWGVKTDMQGKNVTSILHARCILRAITGNLDIPGGDILPGPCPKANCGPEFEYLDMVPPEQRKKQLGADRHGLWGWPGYEIIHEVAKSYWYGKGTSSAFLPACHEPDIWHAIITGEPYPLKALICSGNNPLLAYPNTKRVYKGLKSSNLELFVVLEQWMTPTAMLADYVFPVTNWLEMPVVHSFTTDGAKNSVEVGERVVEPLYERKPDYYFYQGLGLRLGQEKYWRKTLEEEWDWCLEPLLDELHIDSAEEFAKKKRWWSPPLVEKRYEQINPQTGKQWGFATPTGKVEVYSTILDKLGYDPMPHYEEPPETPISNPKMAREYPYVMITGARFRPMHHSEHRQIPSLRKLYPYPTVEINPETARRLGIGEGDWVIIETSRGKIKQKAKLTAKIPPRMVEVQHGWWFPEEIAEDPVLYRLFESNVNVLTPDDDRYCDPPTGAITFVPLLCKVYPAKKFT